VVRSDRQRSELVEGETALREAGQDLVDAVEFGVEGGVVGGLPGPGALKADAVAVQELSKPFAADAHPAVGVAVQVGGEFAQAPPAEGQARPRGAGRGRRHDERDVVGADQAGTASRPARVQRRQAAGVEVVDHVPHGVRVGRDQPGDRRRGCPGRRGQDDHRPPHPDRALLAPPHVVQQATALVLG
jgi:hypothetical protein